MLDKIIQTRIREALTSEELAKIILSIIKDYKGEEKGQIIIFLKPADREKLEKGDYDWAHLAYAIWPERVKEKCKIDLSIAIAHDLEDVYEGEAHSKKRRKGKTSLN